jgi:P pilus assembly chaperone PapD
MGRILAAVVPLLAGLPLRAAAQGLVVAPHAVYLDHRTRSASVTLYNPGTEPVEAMVSTFYAYPVTDSTGHFMLQTPDSVSVDMPAANGWIEAFPRRMTIPPLQRQTVRLLARPPQGLPDGEYWARLSITTKGGAIPVTGADTNGIAIGLSLEIRTILPLLYRKGRLNTGVVASNLRAARTGDSLLVRLRLQRQGTAAYIGTVTGRLLNGDGKSVATLQQPVAIYYEADPVFTLPVGGLAPGSYRLQVEVGTDRTDIAPELILQAPLVQDSLGVILP